MTRALTKRERLQAGANPVVKPFEIPSCYDGWNTRDSFDAMAPTDAVLLDNWYPNVGGVTLRNGFIRYASGVSGGAVQTLAEYEAATRNTFLAAAGGSIYDITGSVVTVLRSGFGSSIWQTVNFLSRTFFFNGVDTAQVYDGSTVADAAFTGVTLSTLVGGVIYQQRLYTWQKNSTGFWFAPLNSISGALSFFDLAPFTPRGGNLVAAITMSHDGGNNVQDFIVFMMSSGDVLLYFGNDPSLISAFQILGVYRLAPVVNARAVCNYGAEAFATTLDDHLQLQQELVALKLGQLPPRSKVSGAVQQAVAANASAPGWQALYYPKGRRLIFNIPNTDGTFDQHVCNTASMPSQPWCRFRGMPANCWGLFKGNLYFGSAGGSVFLADTGNMDLAGAIYGDAQQAWNQFDIPLRKRVTAIRPIVQSLGRVNYNFGVGFDYDRIDANIAVPSIDPGPVWDITPWDTSLWAPEVQVNTNWHIAAGTGQSVGFRLRVSGLQPISWLRTDFRMEIGSAL